MPKVVMDRTFRWLGVEPGEERLFAWGAAALFMLGWAEVAVKNVSETLFFKRVGVEHLPVVFLVNSFLLVATTLWMARVAARSDRLKLLPLVFLALALALVPLWFLVLQDVTSAFVLLVIASKQLQSLGLMIFFLALADLLHGRQAKRLFAPLTAGVTLGTIVGSFASGPISRATGIAGLLPLAACALVVSAVAAWQLRRFRTARFDHSGRDLELDLSAHERVVAGMGFIARFRELSSGSRLFRLLFLMTACSGLIGPMLYFQFSYVADLATQGAGGEERLMAFYSQFRGWLSIGVLATQLGLTTNLYRRIGIPLATVISPVIYLLGFLGLSVRMSLPAGVGAMAGTTLQDNAVYDPAIRILFNLLPENIRSRAMALLEGPVKRAGGALGNLLIIAAVGAGSAVWVGFAALPVAAVWLVVSMVLWRAYPALLMQAAASRARFGEDFDPAELIDGNTVRGLSPHLLDPDPERCRVAIDLVSEAKPQLAAEILSEASAKAPDATRSMLVAALDRVLERALAENFTNATVARHIESLLEGRPDLSDRDRADLIQAYGRVTRGEKRGGPASDAVFERALTASAPAVRLAAAAELHRRGRRPEAVPDLSAALRAAIGDPDPVLRRTAREEYRTQLLGAQPSPDWERLLLEFAAVAFPIGDRAEVAEALADIARLHGEAVAPAGRVVLAWRDDPDLRLRTAVIRLVGAARLADQAGWVVKQVSADAREDLEPVRAAARDAVRNLGLAAADALLVELAFGKRSAREAILPLVRELHLGGDTLQALYENELNACRHKLVDLFAAVRAEFSPLILQRLGERVDEGLHTALQLLGAVHDDDRIYALADPLRRARGTRRYAILLEALDTLLTPGEKATLLPLLEDRNATDRGRAAARALGIEPLAAPEMAARLRESPDELTRAFAGALLAEAMPLAAPADVDEHDQVLSPVECALLLRGVPLFEGLTARQLMNVADLMVEEGYSPGAEIAQRGDESTCMYIIASGEVEIRLGEKILNRLGPNQFFGEIAVFEGAGRTADVVSGNEAVVLLRLDRDDLLSLMEELPGIAVSICKSLSGLVSRLTDRVEQ